jgi:chromosome partitioning protein
LLFRVPAIPVKTGFRDKQGSSAMTQRFDEPVEMEMPDPAPTAAGVRRLLVSSPKGGTGKTTASRNIAVLAAQDGLRVAAVDFDPQQSLGHWWSRRPKAAAPVTYFEAKAEMAADIGEIDGHDLVIIDTPPGVEFQPAAIRALVKAAHFVLVPTNQYSPDLASVEEWMRFLREEGTRAAYLLGNTHRRTKSFEDAKRRLVKSGPLCPIDVPHYEDIPATNELGIGIAEVKGGKGADDYRGVWDFVRGELGL